MFPHPSSSSTRSREHVLAFWRSSAAFWYPGDPPSCKLIEGFKVRYHTAYPKKRASRCQGASRGLKAPNRPNRPPTTATGAKERHHAAGRRPPRVPTPAFQVNCTRHRSPTPAQVPYAAPRHGHAVQSSPTATCNPTMPPGARVTARTCTRLHTHDTLKLASCHHRQHHRTRAWHHPQTAPTCTRQCLTATTRVQAATPCVQIQLHHADLPPLTLTCHPFASTRRVRCSPQIALGG